MDGPLVSTIASVSVRDGGYLLLLVVATTVRLILCVEGERVNDKGWGAEQERKGKNRGRVRERERERGNESVKRGRRETACGKLDERENRDDMIRG